MVTFRFYVVSTVAFFLALAVGVVVGSVLDDRIADSLRDRLDGVEQSLDETVASIDAKNAEIDQLERYMDESAPFAVQDRLTSSATLVTAETGIEPAAVENLVRRLRQAGSRVEGVVWLDRRLDLADADDRELVSSLVGLPTSSAPAALRAALWAEVVGTASGANGAGGSGSGPPEQPTDPSSTTAPTTTAPTTGTALADPPAAATPSGSVPLVFDQSPLSDLAEAGIVRLQSIDGDTGSGVADELLVVTATGGGSTATEPGTPSVEVATASGAAGVPTVLAEVFLEPGDDEAAAAPDRGALIVLPEAADTALISTVDDLEIVPGRVATVLALADLREGRRGRYGLGPDVDGILPPWQGP